MDDAENREAQMRYWAFISYSSKDRRWGEWLHRRLENYPIPTEFRGLELFDGAVLGKNLRPVFRDRDELSSSADLGAAIRQGLQGSRFLVVLCSKNAAKSKWVNKEIEDFQAMGKGQRILALILDGEPNATAAGNPDAECFPPALRYPAEPIAGDLRKEGDGKARGFLKILAGIAQLDFDKLYRRHERAMAKKRLASAIVALVLIGIFAAIAGYALKQRDAAVALVTLNKQQLHTASMADYAVAVQRIENDNQWHEGVAYLTRSLDLEPDNSLAAARLFSTLAFFGPGKQNWPQAILHHEDQVDSVRFSKDGAYAVTACEDQTVQVWNTASGERIGRILQHVDLVWDVDISPDGTRVASAIQGSIVLIWDVFSGKLISRLHCQEDTVQEIQFCPDGLHLVTMNRDHVVRTWNLFTGKLAGETTHRIAKIEGLDISADSAAIVRFSPDGTLVAKASDGEVLVKNVSTGEIIGEPIKHESEIGDVMFSDDGSRIATYTGGRLSENVVRLWDAHSGKAVDVVFRNSRPISTIDINSDGSSIAIGCDRSVYILHVASETPLGEPLRSSSSVTSAIFSPDGKRLLTTGFGEATARVWDTTTGKLVGAPLQHQMAILDAQFSPDSTRIITASEDTTAQIWSAVTGKAFPVLLKHQGPVSCARFNPSSTLVLTISDDIGLIWNAASGSPYGVPLQCDGTINSAQFNRAGSLIVTTSDDGAARFWKTDSGRPVGMPLLHDETVDMALFSPDGSRIITVGGASANRFVRVWSEVSSNPGSVFLDYSSYVNDIQFSSDGSRIITSGNDRTVRIWDSASGELIPPPMPVAGHNSHASLSPDDSLIATVGEYGSVKFWDVGRHKPIGETLCHASMVTSIRFSPDGRRIVTTGEDGTARLFDAMTLMEIPIPVPVLMREFARSIAGCEFNEDGELRTMELEKRLLGLKTPPDSLDRWAILARWLITPVATRSITPNSNFTFRQIAERERDTLLRTGLESAIRFDSTVPLARLLLSNTIEKDESSKSVDERDATIPARAAYLRRYDLDRLPDDVALWTRAARALIDAPTGAMVGIGPKALPAQTAALTTAEKAVALLKDNKPHPAHMHLVHAYLFNGQFEKAKAVYEQYRGTAFEDGRKWNDELRNDIKALREAGHDHPDMKKVEALLEEGG